MLRFASAISLVVAAACEPFQAPLSTEQHLEFVFEHSDREPCTGSLEYLDRHIVRIFEFLDSEIPADLRVPVHITKDVPCSAYACYRADTRSVYVPDLDLSILRPTGVLRHELAHAVIYHAWGESASFFEEGLAEVMARQELWSTPSAPTMAVGHMLDKLGPDIDYRAAARFVRFLIDSRGIAAFKRLFQAAVMQSGEAIRANFQEVYDESFDAIESEFLASGPHCQYQLDLCDPSAAKPLGAAWSEAFAASCLDPDFYGSDGVGGPVFATWRLLRLEEAGAYRLRILGDGSVSPAGVPRFLQVGIVRCGDCDQQRVHWFRPGEHELEFEPGLYALEILLVAESVVTISLERMDGPVSP